MFYESEDKFTAIDETQPLIADTIQHVRDVVCSTMGPDGQVVVIQEGTAVKTTKDGATVARSLEFKNHHQDKINQIIAEAARKTELECGDGTTTTIFLTHLYYHLFLKYPGFINRRRIEKHTQTLIEYLRDDALLPKVGDKILRQVATITANQDESIVNLIMDIYDRFENPVIDLQEGNTLEDKISDTKGQRLRMVMSDAIFSENRVGGATAFEGVRWLVLNHNFVDGRFDPQEMGQLFSDLAKKYPGDTIGVVSTQMSTSFVSFLASLNTVLRSHTNGKPTSFAGFSTNMGGSLGGLLMGDIATVLNADLLTSPKDMAGIELRVCPEKVVSTMTNSTTTVEHDETKERIQARIAEIRSTLDSMNSGARFSPMGKSTEMRMQQLAGQVVTVYVGGETLSDIKERKDRFEDVGLAVKSALLNGVLPGCGIALRDAAVRLWEEHQTEIDRPDDVILEDIMVLCFKQWAHLTGAHTPEQLDEMGGDDLLMYGRDRVIINLATGEEGEPEDLGVFDTAYASITALKGGMTTAKILANTSSIILGSRAGAIHFDGK